MKMRRLNNLILMSLILTVICLPWNAAASTFDTNDTINANNANYWPFGDANNSRYQLWMSQSMLSGQTGTIDQITHFTYSETRNSSYGLEIYASTTSTLAADLSTDYDLNSGSNRTLIFSGILNLLATPTLTIGTSGDFVFDGSGNLLLDYVFKSFENVDNSYDGPRWQSVGDNTDFYRITDHQVEHAGVYSEGAIRTAIEFGNPVPTPEPSTFILLGAGLIGLVSLGRKRMKA